MVQDKSDAHRPIADNRRARHDYEILETLEAGLVLTGSEVKSLRAGKVQVAGAHVRIIADEAWLVGLHIAEYAFAHQFNHDPDRARKLLLHRREIDRIFQKLREKGLAAPLLHLYFCGARVKAEIGIGRGRKAHDRRQAIATREARRDIERVHRR